MKWVATLAAAAGMVAIALSVISVDAGREAIVPSTSAMSLPTAPPTVDGGLQTQFPGWDFRSSDIEPRQGVSYAVSDNLFFGWGGAPSGIDDPRNDGFLIELDTFKNESVAPAPLLPRSSAASVWTGSEFIVFGGHSGEESFVDGASYNPVTAEWTVIAAAPISPAAYPAAVWTGREMLVWVSDENTRFPDLPNPGPGQVAAYNPTSDHWRTLDSPPIAIIDGVLLADGNLVTLVGGPMMRDVGTAAANARLYSVTLDVEAATWGEPVDSGSPFTGFARAVLGPGSQITVFTSPSIYAIKERRWIAIGRVHNCPEELAVTSGGGVVYVKGLLDYSQPSGCTAKIFEGSLDGITQILEWNAYGRAGDSYSSAFLATDDGRLVTFGLEGISGRSVVGVYDQ